jgi:hypothetical protein
MIYFIHNVIILLIFLTNLIYLFEKPLILKINTLFYKNYLVQILNK